MTGVTDDVLASIDGALAAYGTVDYGDTGCSMRWRPEPPVLVICGEGQALWPLRAGLMPDAGTAPPEHAHRCTVIAVTASMEQFADEMAKAVRAVHDLYAAWRPRKHKRQCPKCNPAGNPRPLKAGGHEYQRRCKARMRRKRGR